LRVVVVMVRMSEFLPVGEWVLLNDEAPPWLVCRDGALGAAG